MSPAVTVAGPVAESCKRLGPSPSMRRAICFTFSTMSVTSSRTPARLLNSCRTFSILIEVMAAPCSEESNTRRSALPSVRPKPRSSGSATKVALRLASDPALISRPTGLLEFLPVLAVDSHRIPLWVRISTEPGHLRRGGAPPHSLWPTPVSRGPPATRGAEKRVRRGGAWPDGHHCAGSRSHRGST